ncbi:MAG: polysaccharide biosynthesis tyrosine autokinase [Candidatus Omnitrophota bacterium]|nr:polysaccharide biosynthesis tyrosine autokinase [Candidatus Omnitrophota bacterium]
MRTNINLERDIELGLREYWEILYKRRFFFIPAFLATFIAMALFVIFAVHVKYQSTAVVIIAPPSVQIIKSTNVYIREFYDTTNEVEVIQSDAIAVKVSELLRQGGEYNFDISPGAAKEMLTVSNRPRTNIVQIAAVSNDRYKAFFALKAVIAVYTDYNKELRAKAVQDMYNALTKQLAEKRKEIEAAENALTKFLLDNEIIAIAMEVGTSEIEADVADKSNFKKEPQINEKYLLLKSQRMDKEAFLKEIKNYRKEDDLTALAVIAKRESKMVDLTLRDALYERERELAKLLVTQSELHPDVISIKGEVEEAKKKIAFEVDRAIQSLEINIKSLAAEEDKLRRIIDVGLSDKMVEYSTLRRDLEVKRSIYSNFLNELQIVNVADKLQNIPFLSVVKAPLLSTRPLTSKLMYIFFAFLFSLMVASSFTFVLEHINISIESVEEVESILGLAVLATIPLWKKRQEIAEDQEERADAGLVTLRHPKSVISEAFRMLRNNIKFLDTDKKIKSLVITSPSPKEGKSFICANLAIVMAGAGERIVLIDADLRRPVIHKYFNIENTKGLSNFLIGEESLQDIKVYNSNLENLKVIPSGPIPSNPNELLGTRRMHDLIVRLNEENNIVIIDSPPILAVSDSLILSAKADGTILVIFANSTTKDSGVRTKLLLKNTGANILGSVLNGVEGTRGGYYYCGHEYYSDEK